MLSERTNTKKEKENMMRATLKDKYGNYVNFYRDKSLKLKDWLTTCILNEKIIQDKRELKRSEIDKALDLGYYLKIKDTWTDEDVIVQKEFKNGRMIVTENGKETDEYLPYSELRPDTKYFLVGEAYGGFYTPF